MANGFTTESQFTTAEHTFVLNHNEVVELVIHGSANGALTITLKLLGKIVLTLFVFVTACRPCPVSEIAILFSPRLIFECTTSPFHLHGHAFSIIQGRDGPPNYVNPPRRGMCDVSSGW